MEDKFQRINTLLKDGKRPESLDDLVKMLNEAVHAGIVVCSPNSGNLAQDQALSVIKRLRRMQKTLEQDPLLT